MQESTEVDGNNNDSEDGNFLDDADDDADDDAYDDPDVMNDIEFFQSATGDEIETWKETNGSKPSSYF
eukprot:6866005-Ditylum_brightwellii.AAC.1